MSLFHSSNWAGPNRAKILFKFIRIFSYEYFIIIRIFSLKKGVLERKDF